VSQPRNLLGGMLGALVGVLWTPLLLLLLPRVGLPDGVVYAAAASLPVGGAVFGARQPRWGGAALTLTALAWVGVALLVWLRVLDIA
jgi:hypothetical protein